MVKGWETNEDGTYYFDPTFGTMAKGKVEIEGKEYNFDEATGILVQEAAPTDTPTEAPIAEPTGKPTADPTTAPTTEPSSKPVAEPTAPPINNPEETMEWDITDGKLTVTGRIVGEDLWHGQTPWRERTREITSVVMKGVGVGSFSVLCSTISDCENLESIDLSGLDTSDVTSMSGMFSGCEKLKSIDLSGLDTFAVIWMNEMFHGCKNLKSLDLSGFDTSAVTEMYFMFYGCKNLTEILVDGKKWHIDLNTNTNNMFGDCGVSEVTMK